MAFTIILLLAPQAFIPALRPWRIALIAAGVGVTAHLLQRFFAGRPLMTAGREMAFTLGLVGWAVITLPLSYWPQGSVSFLIEAYLKTVALFWLLGNVVDTLPRLRTVAWGLTWMAVPLALTGVKNFVTGSFVGVGTGKRILGYEAGLTENPNDLALILDLILPLTVALWANCRDAGVRLLLLAIVALEAAGVMVTFSRGGFLTLATVFAVFLFRGLRRGRVAWAAVAVVGALLVVLVLPADFVARMDTITDIQSDPTGSAQARWRDTAAAMRFVLANPLIGAGVGMNTLALNDVRGAVWTQVHNVYLEYAVELGLPGLALFLLLFRACLRKVRSVLGHGDSETGALLELARLAEGIEVSLLAFAVAAFFYPIAYNIYFYYLAGLAVAAGGVHQSLLGLHEETAAPTLVPAT